ncbi:hydantoinase/oxoprolinase family protein [candidate division KSB1 bacterium]|nr:MAG: hydantoinase/oxoprolinase family protein [candidate division KSB1 bacterium]
MIKLCIDTGGTFTDFVIFRDGKIEVLKILSTPDNPANAVISGVNQLSEDFSKIENIVYGTTIATNAFLERKGAKTCIITTKGFEDIIEIGRQNRPDIYTFYVIKPSPLVPESLRFGVNERTNARGEVEKKINPDEIKTIIDILKKNKVKSAAICFLHSYKNSKNEEMVAKLFENIDIHISCSSKIIPEYREYERFSTTVVNSYVSPVMSEHLSELENKFYGKNFYIMKSNGGMVLSSTIKEEAVHSILSGPSAGVIGAYEMGKLTGNKNIITFDMGGTSTDVSICPGKILTTSESEFDGFPVRVPIIDIYSIGAGGGSIAKIDPGGALNVGPESAGADPGPVCYGKGNSVTVTDANLFVGKLDKDFFLGGKMKVYPEKTVDSMEKMAAKMGLKPEKLGAGILQVVNANMERALSVVSVKKGYDPSRFALFTFGGAGGLHAVELAEKLKIPVIISPKNQGIFSAFGMLFTDIIKDYSLTVLVKVDEIQLNDLKNLYRPLIEKGIIDMKKEGIKKENIIFELFADLRYSGQSFEITIPFDKNYIRNFHNRHYELYGYSFKNKPVELVNIRLKAIYKTRKVKLRKNKSCGKNPSEAYIKKKKVIFREDSIFCSVYRRELLKTGNRITGPALIYEYSSTTFIPPGYIALIDEFENMIITKLKGNFN